MDDLEIIRKVRKEHARLREIKQALASALESPPGRDAGQWLDGLRASFEHYRAHLIHRIALEEIGGFLNVVLERRPTLSHQVEHLKQGNAEMIELAGTTLAELRKLDSADRQSLKQASLLVKMALSEINYHEEAEGLLVSFVFTQDTGVGD